MTTPLWYGFWINSPLQRPQVEFLHELLDAACDHDDPEDRDIRHFLNALVAAICWELPVHVSLAPLGHTELRLVYRLPALPSVQSERSAGRWKDTYPSTPHKCRVCGHTFNPDENQSSEQDDMDWDADRLDKQLGNAGYEQFVRAFLIHGGCISKQVDEVIDNKNNGPLLERIKAMRKAA